MTRTRTGSKGKLGRGDAFAAARTYLGLEQKDIQAALKEGQSLAELAVSKGKTRDGLIAAILAALDPAVDQAKAKPLIEKLVDAKTQPKPLRPVIKREGTLERIETVLDALVAAGKITAEQKAAILAGLKGALERKPEPRADVFRFSGEVYQATRDYLGATQEEIMKTLKDGKSLAELAVAKGKTRDGLIQAILAAVVKASPATDVATATEAIGKIVDQKFQPNAGLNKPKPTDKPKPSATPKPSPTATAAPSATPTATANVTNLRLIQTQSVRGQQASGNNRR